VQVVMVELMARLMTLAQHHRIVKRTWYPSLAKMVRAHPWGLADPHPHPPSPPCSCNPGADGGAAGWCDCAGGRASFLCGAVGGGEEGRRHDERTAGVDARGSRHQQRV